MTFKNAVLNTTTEARTANGMKALQSTLNHNVDLFFKIGASRGKNITQEFERAYHEDRETALRILQWARDARGGAGERELYRQVLKFLEKNYRHELLDTKILDNVAELGRWDDLLIFEDREVNEKAFGLIRAALESGNGLAAKWMPRKGITAIKLRDALGWSPKFYRKRLVELTKVVESQMCAKDWNDINFSHVPSLAMSRYSKAFGRNAPEHFTTYKAALQKGEAGVKVNAGAVYPYDITKNVMRGDAALADEQWKALPNYIGDSMVMPIVDVSGSMTWTTFKGTTLTPLDVAVSLGLYCSDKNTGPFKDLFLTFSEKPKFVHVKGTISQKVRQMTSSDGWGMNTNLHAAFDEILKVAVANKVDPKDMPRMLLIMSDMQFDQCTRYDDSALKMIQRKYTDAGYTVPVIAFWNLNASDNVPVRFDERGTALISGFSPAIMKSVLSADFDNITPVGIMNKTIGVDRYAI